MSDRKTHIQATDDAIAAFLANGGVIQQLPPGKSGIPEGYSQNAWGRPKKKMAEAEIIASDELDVPTIDSDLDSVLDGITEEILETVDVDDDLFSGIVIEDDDSDGDGSDDEVVDELEN